MTPKSVGQGAGCAGFGGLAGRWRVRTVAYGVRGNTASPDPWPCGARAPNSPQGY